MEVKARLDWDKNEFSRNLRKFTEETIRKACILWIEQTLAYVWENGGNPVVILLGSKVPTLRVTRIQGVETSRSDQVNANTIAVAFEQDGVNKHVEIVLKQ